MNKFSIITQGSSIFKNCFGTEKIVVKTEAMQIEELKNYLFSLKILKKTIKFHSLTRPYSSNVSKNIALRGRDVNDLC